MRVSSGTAFSVLEAKLALIKKAERREPTATQVPEFLRACVADLGSHLISSPPAVREGTRRLFEELLDWDVALNKPTGTHGTRKKWIAPCAEAIVVCFTRCQGIFRRAAAPVPEKQSVVDDSWVDYSPQLIAYACSY